MPGGLAVITPRLSYAARGAKRRRTGGALKRIGGSNRLADHRPNQYGRREDLPDIARAIYGAERRPLGKHARDLLADFMRRLSFWRAVKDDRLPVEFAGRTFLDVDRRRAEQVLAEMAVGGPLPWFFRKVAVGLGGGKIAKGAETSACPVADKFFGLMISDTLKRELSGGRMQFITEEARDELDALQREALDYTLCKLLDARR